jgi:hypothetical protein
MYELSSSQLLIICEQGTQQPIIERVEMILAMALPTLTASQINALTIGERNQHLLKIRAAIFGDNIACISNCIHCQEAVEFTLDATTLITTTQPLDDFTFSIADKVHKFRLITGADLKLAMQQPTVAVVAKTLIEQCLATPENPLDVADLSDADIKQLAEQLKRHDPAAELLINLSCPACATSWQTAFDIAAFLWNEIVAYGKQLLQQVHCLAQAYGWDEATILELSTKRRQYYINQVMQ